MGKSLVTGIDIGHHSIKAAGAQTYGRHLCACGV